MEVLSLLLWLSLAAAEYSVDLSHVEDFIRERKYALKRKFQPLFHISAPFGWLNIPTGFTYYKRRYHVFYQYHPYNGAWSVMNWGHVASTNFVNWVYLPPALLPREPYEQHGCLGGTALVHNGYMTVFYTGIVQQRNKTFETQNVAVSADGIVFQKYLYNPVIRLPPYRGGQFRNPRVWKYRNTFYMIVAAESRDGGAQLVLYKSPDIFSWTLVHSIAKSFGDMGYLWECPDFFELNGQYILILSARGIQADGFRFRNLHQNGYVMGRLNYDSLQFEELEVSTSTYKELDNGHDFYGAQTMLAPDGRRLLIAWLGMWDSVIDDSKDGCGNMLTLVRELTFSPNGDRLRQTPVREITRLRREILEEAWYTPGEAFVAGAKSFEMLVNASNVNADASISFEWGRSGKYTIMYSATYRYVSVHRSGPDGERRADWLPTDQVFWRIFVDASSIEVFCGDGEVVFSSRIYPNKLPRIRIGGENQIHIAQYRLKKSVGYDKKLRSNSKENIIDSYNLFI